MNAIPSSTGNCNPRTAKLSTGLNMIMACPAMTGHIENAAAHPGVME